MDIMDMPGVEWGGICGSVWIEQTKRAWIENVFVRPRVGMGVAEVTVETGSRTLYGSPERPPDFHIEADVLDETDKVVGSNRAAMVPGLEPSYMAVGIDNPKLWSPKSPHLYQVNVRLYFEDTELDSITERFGMREIAADGSRFMLNGKPIFLRGFGDDCVFPNTIAPPADKEVYKARFKIAKEYGFNYVRCHSWIPPKEYLDAADEAGIMVQPELPIAYAPFYDAGTPELEQFYKDTWVGVIKANRNHPSIVTWSMSNEMWGGFDLAQSLYMSAIQIDPTRLIVDSDGVLPPKKPTSACGPTLDFYSVQFDEAAKMGFEDHKYDLGKWKPEKPVVIHEMGNFGTFPNLGEEKLFSGGIRPYWLTDARLLAEKKGVAAQLTKWKTSSDRLQAVALKTNIEAARLARRHQRLRSMAAAGLLDRLQRRAGHVLQAERHHARPSSGSSTRPRCCSWTASRRSYRLGETAAVKLLVSRYEDAPSTDAKLSWKLVDSGKAVRQGQKSGLKITADGLQPLMSVALKMPASGAARKLTLSAQITDSNGTVSNSWDLWIFPAARAKVSSSVCIAGCEEVAHLYPKARSIGVNATPDRCGLLIASKLTQAGVDYLSAGGKVLLLGGGELLPAVPSTYKPYWWLGNADGDSNAGTVLNNSHPALARMPKADWCNLEWYHLLTGSKAVLLDGFPGHIEPIIRCIDLPSTQRNKAYLFEARVGKGKLLVASMDFRAALRSNDPCAAFFVDELIRYALGPRFAPVAALTAESLLRKAQ